MAYQTYGEIKSFSMQMLSEQETDQVFRQGLLSRWATRTRDRINEWHNWMWKEGLIRLTWPGIDGGDSTASVLYLPEDVGQILSMYPNQLSYREPVRIMQRWEFDQLRPGNTIGRGIDYLVLWGYYSVKADNPTTGKIDITASGGAAAAGLQVRVIGRKSDNDAAREVVTLDAAGVGQTVNDFLGGAGLDGVTACEIVRESLVTLTDPGMVSFKSASGLELENLDADQGEIKKERRRTELYAQIGGAGTYQIAYYRRYKPLVADSDPFLPELPNEFTDLVEDGVMSQIALFRKEWDTKSAYDLMWKERMRELQAWSNREPGVKRRLVVNRQFGTRFSRG